jgi:hypothetical protein
MKRVRKYYEIMKNGLKYILGITAILAILIIVSSSKINTAVTKTNTVSGIQIPDKIDFAGEQVPVNYFDVKEGLERELLVNSYWHSQTLLLIKRANRYLSLIEPILKKNNIPDDFKYLALAESGFANVRSPAGALGFWQFMPTTGKQYGLEINKEIDERYNLEKSTEAACRLLSDSYKDFGNWTMVAASYNCGRAGLNNQIRRQYSKNYYDLLLNDETGRYIYRIIALKLIIGDPAKYGFTLSDNELYQPIPVKSVNVSEPIKDLALFAFRNGTNYKILKLLNPWLLNNFLTNIEKKTYMIKIPAEGFREHSRELSRLEADSIGTASYSAQK